MRHRTPNDGEEIFTGVVENDDPWLDDEETDADDDTPILDDPSDGIEWDEDDDEEC